MDSFGMKSIYTIVLLLFSGYGPLVETVLNQGLNVISFNSPAPQMINELLTAPNNGVLPEIVSTTTQQNRGVNQEICSAGINNAFYKNLFPITASTALLPVQSNGIPSASEVPSVQSAVFEEPVANAPLSVIFPSSHENLEPNHVVQSVDGNFPLLYDDFFECPVWCDSVPFNKIPEVRACGCKAKEFSANLEAIDIIESTIANTKEVSKQGNKTPVPVNVEINLPLITKIVPLKHPGSLNSVVCPPQVPSSYLPPLIIQKSRSRFGSLLPLLLVAMLDNGSDNCCCSCGNSRNVLIPYPIPIPTNNPIIIEDSPRRNCKKKSNNDTKDCKDDIKD